MKVCHFTSAHETTDVRIFLKECQSLQKAGHEVFLAGRGESREQSGIHVVGCGEPKSRRERFLFFSKKVYQKALDLECDVYHFHDPDLLRFVKKLKKKGKFVIFDSHEDVPAQILDKTWIPGIFRSLVAKVYKKYETHIVKRVDAVVAATPYIAKIFEGRAEKTEVINNYPRLDDIQFHTEPFRKREPLVCYIGGVSEARGEKIMLEAMKKVDGRLIIAGKHEKTRIEDRGIVEYTGQIDREAVNQVYGQAVAGLVVLKPCKNYINSQPIKMYEYMAAGLPVIYSDFPAWKKIMEKTGAGIAVNPEKPEEAAKAINYLLKNREAAREMGRKGREAIEQKYSWNAEEEKLIRLYAELEAEK